MIDLHCHVLPGLDDGPDTIEQALALCHAAVEAGTDTIVATPHVNFDYPDNNPLTMHAAVAALNKELAARSLALKIRPGAELGLTRAAELSDAELGVLGLAAGPSVLVECPYGTPPRGIEIALRTFAARARGIVLAHPERSLAFQREPQLLEDMINSGMHCCVTAKSLSGGYGRDARARAWEFLSGGLVHVLASDAHHATDRPPDLGPELRRAGLGEAEIEYFTQLAPEAILTGKEVPVPPRIERPRGRWGRAGARR